MRVCALIQALGQGDPDGWVRTLGIATTLRPAELAADAALPEPLRVHATEVRAAALRRPQA